MKVAFGLKKAATLCILKHKDEFLLLKRAKEPHQGKYTPLGGKLEAHESPLEAAIRETKEESGIDLPHMDFWGVMTETSPVKYNWICYVYSAEIDKIPPPPCPEGILEWVHTDQLLDISTPKTDWFIYQYILNEQKFILDVQYDESLHILSMKEELSGQLLIG
ncbi:MAG: NUDIX domain-containing protein [Bacteroidota bacterium]